MNDGGFDLHFLLLSKRKYLCCRRPAGGKQCSTGALHLDGFESHHLPKAKRKSTPNGVLFFLAFSNLIYIFR